MIRELTERTGPLKSWLANSDTGKRIMQDLQDYYRYSLQDDKILGMFTDKYSAVVTDIDAELTLLVKKKRKTSDEKELAIKLQVDTARIKEVIAVITRYDVYMLLLLLP